MAAQTVGVPVVFGLDEIKLPLPVGYVWMKIRQRADDFAFVYLRRHDGKMASYLIEKTEDGHRIGWDMSIAMNHIKRRKRSRSQKSQDGIGRIIPGCAPLLGDNPGTAREVRDYVRMEKDKPTRRRAASYSR